MTSSNQPAPEDVVKEIAFYGSGGDAPCENNQGPVISVLYNEASKNWEPGEELYVETCGWGPKELIYITIKYPDGTSMYETQEYRWEDPGSIDWGTLFSYKIHPSDPIGSYILIFEGESGRVECTFNVVKSSEPLLYIDGNQIILRNFEPNENIRLFTYEILDFVISLVAWQEYQVDFNGQIIIQIENVGNINLVSDFLDLYVTKVNKGLETGARFFTFVAVGNASGEVRAYEVHPHYSILREGILIP
jgi:hypothetical protein